MSVGAPYYLAPCAHVGDGQKMPRAWVRTNTKWDCIWHERLILAVINLVCSLNLYVACVKSKFNINK